MNAFTKADLPAGAAFHVETELAVVRLTAAGRALEKQIHAAIADELESWQQRLGRRRFDELLATLVELTGEAATLPTLPENRASSR